MNGQAVRSRRVAVPQWLSHLEVDRRGIPVPWINTWTAVEGVNPLADPSVDPLTGEPAGTDGFTVRYDSLAQQDGYFLDDEDRAAFGHPDFTSQNPGRQRAAMIQGLCQVCARHVPWSRRFLVVAGLSVLGLTQRSIAERVGRDPKTVSSRLRLLKLLPSTQARVAKGQLTLDDASAIADLGSTDPALAKRLESAAKSGGLTYELTRAKRTIAARKRIATEVAAYASAGVPEVTRPKGDDVNAWNLWDHVPGVRSLNNTHDREPGPHQEGGCLRWCLFDEENLILGCAHPDGHQAAKQAARSAEQVARDNAEAAAEQATVERCAAAEARATAVAAVADDPAVLTALAPALIRHLNGSTLIAYQNAMGILDVDRWSIDRWSTSNAPKGARDLTLMVQHFNELADGPPARARTALHTAAALFADADLTETPRLSTPTAAGAARAIAARYVDLLHGIEYDHAPIDTAAYVAAGVRPEPADNSEQVHR